MNVNIHMKDESNIVDMTSLDSNIVERISAKPKKTRVIFKNHETGEVLGEFENKVVITGSNFNAMKAFGLESPVVFPTYNSEMNLDGSTPQGTTPANSPIVCLFCISDSGCGATPKDVYVTEYTSRIKPAPSDPTSTSEFTSDMIMPFRYVDTDDDISDDLRKYYYGRKTFTTLGKIGYYFKSFDTDPQLNLVYSDGTQVTENIYNTETDQSVECYVEMRLRITRLDFRDYFENALGWDNARISSLSLCFAWYKTDDDGYTIYEDITPYTFLPFSYKWLVDADTGIDIDYQIYY